MVIDTSLLVNLIKLKIELYNPPVDVRGEILETVYKIATIVIALANIVFAIYIYFLKNKKDNKIKESDRKVTFFKNLILDYNLKKFYKNFNNLESYLLQYLEGKYNEDEFEKLIQSEFKKLNQDFINVIEVVDKSMKKNLLEISDKCRDEILIYIPQGKESLQTQYYNLNENLLETKKKMLSLLFNYNGGE